jgi:hypothetical protein
VKRVSGRVFGSLATAASGFIVLLGPVFCLLTILEGGSFVGVAEGLIAVALFVVVVFPHGTVEVDDFGVRIQFPLSRGVNSIPWSDISALEGHRFGARLLLRGNGKRRYVQMLDLHWSSRPVSRAIRAHLATSAHRHTIQS